MVAGEVSKLARQTPRLHFVVSVSAAVILAALLAPGDGGAMLNDWLVVIVLSHVGFYLLHYSKVPAGRFAGLKKFTSPFYCFLFSVVGVVVATIGVVAGGAVAPALSLVMYPDFDRNF